MHGKARCMLEQGAEQVYISICDVVFFLRSTFGGALHAQGPLQPHAGVRLTQAPAVVISPAHFPGFK